MEFNNLQVLINHCLYYQCVYGNEFCLSIGFEDNTLNKVSLTMIKKSSQMVRKHIIELDTVYDYQYQFTLLINDILNEMRESLYKEEFK